MFIIGKFIELERKFNLATILIVTEVFNFNNFNLDFKMYK